jgi:hypothetical protein
VYRAKQIITSAALGVALVASFPPPAGFVHGFSVANAQSPYPSRDGVVANGTDMAVSNERINREFADRLGDPYGLDGLALVVDSCQPDPEVYLDGALVHYGLAPEAGAMYDDAVAWLICLDPTYVGFFYAAGNEYASSFDEDEVTAEMPAQLQAGNFTGALTSGLDGAVNAIEGRGSAAVGMPEDNSLGAGAGSTNPNQSDGEADQAPVSRATTSEDDDGAGLLGIPSRLTGLLLAGVAAVVGWFVYRRRRLADSASSDVDASKPAVQRSLEQTIAELDERLTPNSPELARIVVAYDAMGDEAVLDLNRRHMSMVERLAELKRRVDALTTGAVPAALSDDPEELAARYESPTAEAAELLEYVNYLADEADHVEMLQERAAILVVEAENAITDGREAYERAAHGFDLPTSETAFAYPTKLQSLAEEVLATGDRISGGRLAEEAAQVAGRIADVPVEMRRASDAIDDAIRLFPRFEGYAESSWSDVRGNGSEAQESLDAAQEMMQRITAADHAEFGSDETAGYMVSLVKVFDELERAQALVAAVSQRLERLREAKQGSREAVAAVKAEIDEARQWLADPEVDRSVDHDPVVVLNEAEQLIAEAESEMAAGAPDWLSVQRAVQQADRAVDTALAGAREQQQRMESLRRQLETAKTTAEAAVERGERFLASHRQDIDATSAARVRDAEDALKRAHESVRAAEELEDAGLADALSAAADEYAGVTGLAERAYEAMNEDFERADRRRDAYVPRPTWIGPTVPVPVGRRNVPFPIDIGGWGGGGISRPSRRSSWGGGRSPSGPKPSSGRRGGGRGW